MIIQHYLELLRYHRMRFITLVIATVVAFALVNTAKLLMSPVYTAAAAVTIVPTQAEMAFTQGASHQKEAARVLTETYIEYVKSRPVIVDAIGAIEAGRDATDSVEVESRWAEYIARIKGLKSTISRWISILNYGDYIPPSEDEKKINKIRKAIDVKNITNTHILRIEVNLSNPEMAARLANTLAERFVERMSRELNDDASRLEQLLKDEIKPLETAIEALRAKQAAYKKRYGILPENSSEKTQIGILEQQLAELHTRLLSIRLSRTSGTSVHLVESATVPVYPSSPRVLINTLLGLLTGIVLGLIMIVIRDSASDRVVTSADLQRIAGARGIGIMKGAWIKRRNWRALRKLGATLEGRLAIFGDMDTPDPQHRMLPSSAQLITSEEHQAQVSNNVHQPTIKQLVNVELVGESHIRPVLQVTGMTDMVTVCWAAVGVAASLAVQGRNVVCRLPVDFIKKTRALGNLEKWKAGRIRFSDNQQEESAEDALTVQCLGPLTADLNLTQALRRSPAVVCILPVNKIQEEVVEALQQRISITNQVNVSFMLMA